MAIADGAEQSKETGRVEAFSDGVFAIAITLLVLDIKVPRDLPESTRLLDALLAQWPAYFAFVTSFATIGIMWINHHRLFTLIERSDQMLLVLNSLLLGITFVPFPTALLSEYIGEPDQQIAALVYSGTFVLTAICFNLLWRYASHKNRLLDPGSDPLAVQAISRQYAFGPLLYLVAFGLAFVSGVASLALNLLLALFFALPARKTTSTPGVKARRS